MSSANRRTVFAARIPVLGPLKEATSQTWATREASNVSPQGGMGRHFDCGQLTYRNASFQPSAARYMRTPLFRIITQHIVVIPYRRFGTTYRSRLRGSRMQKATESFVDSWLVKVGPISSPETFVRIYHYTLRNSPERRNSRLLRGRSLNSPV